MVSEMSGDVNNSRRFRHRGERPANLRQPAQRRVRRLQVEFLRVESPTHPIKHRATLLVARIRDRFKNVLVSRRPATVLRRTSSGAAPSLRLTPGLALLKIGPCGGACSLSL